MEVRRIEMFLAVAEHQGFTRAARAMFISQPALSQCIAELENDLGTELFYRLGRRVSLTPAGEALMGPARLVIRDLEEGKRAVRAVTGLVAGRLDLCCLPSLAADPVAPLIGSFRRMYPKVLVAVASPRDSADLVRQVREGTCELGITDACDVPKGMGTRPLVTQELFAVLPPGSRFANKSMTIKELSGLPIVSTPKNTYTRDIVDGAFSEAGVTGQFVVVSEQRDAIAPLVLAGAGAAVLPGPLAVSLATHGAKVLGLRPKLIREVVVAHRSARLSPAAQAFVSAIDDFRA